MGELIFWKPSIRELVEEVESHGHELPAFDPEPPSLLPNDAEFSTAASCKHCGAFLHVSWSPFDGEGFTAHGSALVMKCKSKVLPQPAA